MGMLIFASLRLRVWSAQDMVFTTIIPRRPTQLYYYRSSPHRRSSRAPSWRLSPRTEIIGVYHQDNTPRTIDVAPVMPKQDLSGKLDSSYDIS